ncbi:MAG: hypothetical protein H6706_14750 [Myxococcales bacterium]|nr:hypothetical protein [Myxococcales bacterium]
MKVEVQYRWLLLLGSAGVLYTLRNHRIALAIYVAAVVIGVALYAFWLPRRVAIAERRFSRDALKHLTLNDFSGLDALARRQWLIRRFGRRHLVPDTLAVAAAASGNHGAARSLFLEALQTAPADERLRIELNLASSEQKLGELSAAEGRLRSILARRPGLGAAQASLGRVLVTRGEELGEAAALLEAAAESCDPRELPAVHLARAEALARSGQPGADAALASARAAGAPEAELERVGRLASSQSATRG